MFQRPQRESRSIKNHFRAPKLLYDHTPSPGRLRTHNPAEPLMTVLCCSFRNESHALRTPPKSTNILGLSLFGCCCFFKPRSTQPVRLHLWPRAQWHAPGCSTMMCCCAEGLAVRFVYSPERAFESLSTLQPTLSSTAQFLHLPVCLSLFFTPPTPITTTR